MPLTPSCQIVVVGGNMSVTKVCLWVLGVLVVATMATARSPFRTARSLDEQNDMEIIRSCNKSFPISRDTMNTVLINKHLRGTESGGFKCFLHCLYTKYNWMDDVGGFHLRVMKEVLQSTHLESHVVEWILYKCSAIAYPDRCERAYQFTECFWAETSKYPEKEEPAASELDLFNY